MQNYNDLQRWIYDFSILKFKLARACCQTRSHLVAASGTLFRVDVITSSHIFEWCTSGESLRQWRIRLGVRVVPHSTKVTDIMTTGSRRARNCGDALRRRLVIVSRSTSKTQPEVPIRRRYSDSRIRGIRDSALRRRV